MPVKCSPPGGRPRTRLALGVVNDTDGGADDVRRRGSAVRRGAVLMREGYALHLTSLAAASSCPQGLTTPQPGNQPVTARLGATREIRTFFTDRAATVDPLSAVVVIAQRPRERRMVQV